MSGVAFCYNTIYCIAGFTPLITSKIAQACGQPHNAYVFFVGLAIITIIGMRWLPAQKHL
jgi:hypothetical protein